MTQNLNDNTQVCNNDSDNFIALELKAIKNLSNMAE